MGVHSAAAESGRDRDSTLDLTRHNFTATKLQLTSPEVDWTASLTSDRAGIRIHRCTIVIGQPFIESVSGAETQAAIHAVISGPQLRSRAFQESITSASRSKVLRYSRPKRGGHYS